MNTNAPGQQVGPHFRWYNFDLVSIPNGTSKSFSIPVPMGFCAAIIHAKACFNPSSSTCIQMRTYQLAARNIGFGTCFTKDNIWHLGGVATSGTVQSIVRRHNLATANLKVEFESIYTPLEVSHSVQLSVLLLDKPMYEGLQFRAECDLDLAVTSILDTPTPHVGVAWTPHCIVTNVGNLGAMQYKTRHTITGPDGDPTQRHNAYSAITDLPVGSAADKYSTTNWTPATAGLYVYTSTVVWSPDQNVGNDAMTINLQALP